MKFQQNFVEMVSFLDILKHLRSGARKGSSRDTILTCCTTGCGCMVAVGWRCRWLTEEPHRSCTRYDFCAMTKGGN